VFENLKASSQRGESTLGQQSSDFFIPPAFRRILLLSARSGVPGREESDARRVMRMASVLQVRGWETSTLVAGSIADLEAACDSFEPGIVFSAADHLPAGGKVSGHSAALNVHAWLDAHGIAYAGSAPAAIDLALDKAALKRRWMSEGIPTPEFSYLEAPGFAAIDLPAFPCILKPNDAGNSRGIAKKSVVRDRDGLEALIGELKHDFSRFLVERYLGFAPDFQEFTCGMTGNGPERRIMAARILLQDPGDAPIVTTEDKNSNRARAISIEDEDLKARVEACASAAFISAGMRDYARCDLALSDGIVYALEINGQPMVPDTWFSACVRYAGMEEDEYLMAIMKAAMKRAADAGRPGRD
jgi:D-alanine-D-alanine ligase-like ATP-grasp enzyme